MRDKQGGGGRARGRGRVAPAKPTGGGRPASSKVFSTKNKNYGGQTKTAGPKTKFSQQIGTAAINDGKTTTELRAKPALGGVPRTPSPSVKPSGPTIARGAMTPTSGAGPMTKPPKTKLRTAKPPKA